MRRERRSWHGTQDAPPPRVNVWTPLPVGPDSSRCGTGSDSGGVRASGLESVGGPCAKQSRAHGGGCRGSAGARNGRFQSLRQPPSDSDEAGCKPSCAAMACPSFRMRRPMGHARSVAALIGVATSMSRLTRATRSVSGGPPIMRGRSARGRQFQPAVPICAKVSLRVRCARTDLAHGEPVIT